MAAERKEQVPTSVKVLLGVAGVGVGLGLAKLTRRILREEPDIKGYLADKMFSAEENLLCLVQGTVRGSERFFKEASRLADKCPTRHPEL